MALNMGIETDGGICMKKELEALKRVVSEISNYKLHGIGDENWLGIQDVLKDVDILKQAITPSTADEVCKALSEYFGFEYYYQDKSFYKSDGKIYIYPLTVSGFTEIQLYDGHLPPHLITMIGKFYESLE